MRDSKSFPVSTRLPGRQLAVAALLTALAASLCACGGGSSSATTAPIPTPTPAPTLGRLFAPLAQADPSASFKYLKACYFPTQQFGSEGQSGIDFLESLVVDVASSNNAVLYNAQNGNSYVHTNRSYKGSSPIAGAPPQLWTGVMQLNADGSASGFGVPCTPATMLDRPPATCYWLVEDVNKNSSAVGSFTQIGNGRPETASGTATVLNPGWGTGAAYYFYYEMSFGPNCSAPNSKTLWRGGPLSGS